MKEYQLVLETTKPFDDDIQLYRRKTFTFRPGINSLVGCNGSGKSTLMNYFLIPYLRKHKIEYYKYDDRHQGGSMLMDAMLNVYGDMDGLAQMFLSSEGERIVCGLNRVIGSLPRFFFENKNKPAFLLLDAIDSGMSVDEIIEVRDTLLFIIGDAKQRYKVDLYVVVAANNYEWCNDERIHNINITMGTSLRFKSYEDYKKYILKSKETKNKLRKVSDNG